MKCPFCGFEETKVIDSREVPDSIATRRRRECLKCGRRFTTYEKIEEDLVVIKKSGEKEPFMREKVKNGILKACNKRPVTEEQIDALVDNIEMEIRNNNTTEIKSVDIGELVIKKLKELDEVAYLRFVSVFKEFTDPHSFEKEIKQLKK